VAENRDERIDVHEQPVLSRAFCALAGPKPRRQEPFRPAEKGGCETRSAVRCGPVAACGDEAQLVRSGDAGPVGFGCAPMWREPRREVWFL
jgi:hypothetical protein